MALRKTIGSTAALLAGSLAAAGCGGNLSPEDLPNIDGAWNYSETQTAERGLVACNIIGTLGFVQEGETLVGTYTRTLTCSGKSGLTSTVQSGQLSGQVYEKSVQFRLASCDYRGAFSDVQAASLRPQRMTGTTLCTNGLETALADGGAASAWAADRLAEATP